MKRLFLLSGVASIAALSLPSSASAEPAILYIPDVAIDLVPTAVCPVPQGGQQNSGLGCGGVTDPGTIDAFDGDLDALLDGMRTALEPYDVLVTTTRPPEYVPYFMLMPSTVDSETGISFSCTGAATNCGALKRNGMGFTSGNTENCMDPDPLAAALYAFGRMSGLEGVDNPLDAMNYVPDYTMPAAGYEDTCNVLVPEFGFNDQDMQIVLPLACTSRDHEECDPGMGEPAQNSHLDLLARYGTRIEDNTAPTFENMVPADGAEIVPGEFNLDVDIVDDDLFVAARWTISSPALEALGIEGGSISKCTNDACLDPQSSTALNWPDGSLKATDSDWGVTELAMAPAGDYTITLEATDLHGNVSETVTVNVTIPGGGGDESGGVDDTAGTGGGGGDDGVDDGGVFTSGADDDGSGGNNSGAADGGGDDSSGCACNAAPKSGGLMVLLLGLFGLGMRRRD